MIQVVIHVILVMIQVEIHVVILVMIHVMMIHMISNYVVKIKPYPNHTFKLANLSLLY
jgi:hypothetical protein